MNKKLLALTLVAFGLMTGVAHAEITNAPTLFNGLDENGNPINPGTYAMYYDLDNDGWNGNSYLTSPINGNSWLPDPDDFLADRGQIDAGSAFPTHHFTAASLPGYTPGVDDWYVAWFNTPFNAGAAGPGGGVWYGIEGLGKVGADPGDYTNILNGGNATLQTLGTQPVPEPFAGVLMLLGGGVLGLRRRMKRASA